MTLNKQKFLKQKSCLIGRGYEQQKDDDSLKKFQSLSTPTLFKIFRIKSL